MKKAMSRFTAWLKTESDIHDHLQYLYDESEGLILELGVREGVSTSALLAGIEPDEDGFLFSVDTNKRCADIFRHHPQWTFINTSSLDEKQIHDTVLEHGREVEFNLIFIDTLHSFEQVSQELKVWSAHVKVGGKILVHDVITYHAGAGKACEQFSKLYNWEYQVREGSNGLGILTRGA